MTDANETAKEEAIKIPDVLPVLPLKDLVIFPFIIVPLSVSREKSINAVDQALAENRVIMLTAQKDFQNEDPGEEDLYRGGTVAIIMRMLKLPDGRIRILVQGLSRARIDYFIQTAPFFKAKITRIEEPVTKDRGLEVEALIRAVKQNLDRAVSLGPSLGWAAAGPHLTYHLGAGEGGLGAFMQHLMKTFETWWGSLAQWDKLEPEQVRALTALVEKAYGNKLEQIRGPRDRRLASIL